MEDILLLADASDSGKKLSYYLERNDVSVNVTGGPFENSAMLEAAARLMPVAVKNLVYEGADMCATNIDGGSFNTSINLSGEV